MLILRRYAGQTLCIGPDVEVRIIAIERREGAVQVVIGIEAPKEIRVDRLEVRQARNGITQPSRITPERTAAHGQANETNPR